MSKTTLGVLSAVGLVIPILCATAYWHEGVLGLFVAGLLSLVVVAGAASVHSIFSLRRRRRMSGQQEPQHRHVSELTALGLPKAMANELVKWISEFSRNHGRKPSQDEARAWVNRWYELDEGRVLRERFETLGVPNPTAAADAMMDWLKAFERIQQREPSESEREDWLVRWRELHGVLHSPIAPQMPSPSTLRMVMTYGTGMPEETISLCRFHDQAANRKDLQVQRGPEPGHCTFCELGFAEIRQPSLEALQQQVNGVPNAASTTGSKRSTSKPT